MAFKNDLQTRSHTIAMSYTYMNTVCDGMTGLALLCLIIWLAYTGKIKFLITRLKIALVLMSVMSTCYESRNILMITPPDTYDYLELYYKPAPWYYRLLDVIGQIAFFAFHWIITS